LKWLSCVPFTSGALIVPPDASMVLLSKHTIIYLTRVQHILHNFAKTTKYFNADKKQINNFNGGGTTSARGCTQMCDT